MHVIEWTYGDCSLGRYLVAWREQALVWLAFGEPGEEMVRALAVAFPDATRREEAAAAPSKGATRKEAAPSTREASLFALNAYLDGEEGAARPAVAFEGTEFQREVWGALIRIPWGETRSYGALAETLGRPNAARAIGAACGANKIAVLVPCHRVVGQTGDLRGFRWGEALKAQLLEREASQQRLFE